MRVQFMHTAKALPCAQQKTHGKEGLCHRLVAVGLLPCATHGKAFAVCKPGFAVCFWHTANSLCPVVVLDGDASAPGTSETTSADKRRHPQSSCSVLFYMIVWP